MVLIIPVKVLITSLGCFTIISGAYSYRSINIKVRLYLVSITITSIRYAKELGTRVCRENNRIVIIMCIIYISTQLAVATTKSIKVTIYKRKGHLSVIIIDSVTNRRCIGNIIPTRNLTDCNVTPG